MTKSRRNYGIGQALTEYIMCAGLVAVLAIPALLFFSESITNIFNGMIGKAPVQTFDLRLAGNTPTLSLQKTGSTVPSLEVDSIQTAAGNVYQLPDTSSAALNQQIITAGANGTTTLLSNQIESLAKQMLANGEITQDEYTSIAQLSNQGHKIAEIEKLLQDVLQLKDPAKIRNASIPYDGKLYSIQELAGQIGYKAINDKNFWDPNSPSALLNTMYQQLSNTALKDPKANATVKDLILKISAISDGVQVYTVNIIEGDGQMTLQEGINNALATVPGISDASIKTHTYSSEICTTGGNSDSGTHCTP
jgi:hypothetical protein